jgi:opacity protein-like surface antigen
LGFRYKTWFFGPTLHLELRSRLELTGGLHLLRSSVEQRQDAIELLSAWDTGFGASLGVTYHVTGNWATTLHWDRLQLDDWYIDTLQAGFVLRP